VNDADVSDEDRGTGTSRKAEPLVERNGAVALADREVDLAVALGGELVRGACDEARGETAPLRVRVGQAEREERQFVPPGEQRGGDEGAVRVRHDVGGGDE